MDILRKEMAKRASDLQRVQAVKELATGGSAGGYAHLLQWPGPEAGSTALFMCVTCL